MPANLVIIKTPYSPEGVSDALDLDIDPNFKCNDYRSLAERICSNVVWSKDEGQGEIFGHAVSLVLTDGALLLDFTEADLAPALVKRLAAQVLELGAVVMDANSADILSGAQDQDWD